MSKSVKAKVNELENYVLKPLIPESTKLDVSELPEAEVRLYHQCLNMKDYVLSDDYEPNERDTKILTTMKNRLLERVIDIFTTSMKSLYHCDEDNMKLFIFKIRFWFFMFELTRHMEQIDKETELIKKYPKDYEALDREMEAWQKQQENQTPLWTRESFSYWFSDTSTRYEKHVKGNL